MRCATYGHVVVLCNTAFPLPCAKVITSGCLNCLTGVGRIDLNLELAHCASRSDSKLIDHVMPRRRTPATIATVIMETSGGKTMGTD